jgi:hypothetical protein
MFFRQPAIRPPFLAAKAPRGSSLAAVVIIAAVILLGLATLLHRVASSRSVTWASNNKLLANNLAEAACARGLEILEKISTPTDPVYYEPEFHSFDDARFADFAESVFLSLANGPQGKRIASLRSPNDGEYRVVSLDRAVLAEGAVYTIRAEGVYKASNREQRSLVEVDARFLFDAKEFGAAILSDAPDLGTVAGGGKPRAMDGNIVLGKGRGFVAVMGKIASNGATLDGEGDPLTPSNLAQTIKAIHPVDLNQNLYGTSGEIPDFTQPGESKQLFDFDRFTAAADAGAGRHFANLADFAAAAAAGETFQGIVVVDVNPSDYVRAETGHGLILEDPTLIDHPGQANKPGCHYAPAINVAGTLVFRVPRTFQHNGSEYETPSIYRIVIDAPLRVNAANPADIDAYVADVEDYNDAVQAGNPPPVPPAPPAGEAPYGSPSHPLPDPWEVDLGPSLAAFQPGDDLPALMMSMGVLDINAAANVCGAVYAPGFVEIENKHWVTQYFAGTLIAGGGVYVQDFGNSGRLIFAYRQAAVDQLATSELAMKAPVVVAWRQVQ